MNSFYNTMTHRARMVVGNDVMDELAKTKVIIFGVGGVGSWCAESLLRTGIVNITLVDSDIVCPTNINRQVQATSLTIGKSKVDEIKKRFLQINPGANITAIHASYDEQSYTDFDLGSYDYVIDAIDSLKNKIHLIEQCIHLKIKFFSSMGAGAKTDPTKIKIDYLTNTKNCPLARRVRRSLRKNKTSTDFLCVYSEELPVESSIQTVCGTGSCACSHDRENFCDEENMDAVDWCGMKKKINGALVHITGIFGFMIGGLVINDIRNKIARATHLEEK